MMFKRLILPVIAITFCLSGCGNSAEEKELADFSNKMSTFTETIKKADEDINSLDTTNKESVDELLQILDNLDSEFMSFAEISAPSQYKTVESLADQASENLSEAVKYYHNAFESEEFNVQDADIAHQYYVRAMTRVEYIGYIITGAEIPANEHVTVHEESNDSNLIDKWLSDNSEQSESIATISNE